MTKAKRKRLINLYNVIMPYRIGLCHGWVFYTLDSSSDSLHIWHMRLCVCRAEAARLSRSSNRYNIDYLYSLCSSTNLNLPFPKPTPDSTPHSIPDCIPVTQLHTWLSFRFWKSFLLSRVSSHFPCSHQRVSAMTHWYWQCLQIERHLRLDWFCSGGYSCAGRPRSRLCWCSFCL